MSYKMGNIYVRGEGIEKFQCALGIATKEQSLTQIIKYGTIGYDSNNKDTRIDLTRLPLDFTANYNYYIRFDRIDSGYRVRLGGGASAIYDRVGIFPLPIQPDREYVLIAEKV